MQFTRRGFLAAAPFLKVARAAESGVRVGSPAELTAALKQARPGDVILLAQGEWKDADLLVEVQGEEEAPIRVLAEAPGRTVLTGLSRLRLAGRYTRVEGLLFQGCTYPGDLIQFRSSSTKLARGCKLLDCAIVDCNPEDPELTTRWVSIYGSWNEVARCYVAGKKNIGTTLVVWLNGEPNYHRIGECWFGPRALLGVNGGETIRVGDSATSMQDSVSVVENNYFERCDGEIEAISNKSCGNIYQSNFFDRCEATLTLRHGNRCRVEGNHFHGGGSKSAGGIRIIGEGHVVVNNLIEACNGTGFRSAISVVNGLPDSPLNGYMQVKAALIAHNTIIDCAQPVAVGINGGNASLTLPPEDVRVAANRIGSSQEFERAADGVPRPLVWRLTEEQVAEVTEDIDGQRRPEGRQEGCDEPPDGTRLRWRWAADTAGPNWWPRG